MLPSGHVKKAFGRVAYKLGPSIGLTSGCWEATGDTQMFLLAYRPNFVSSPYTPNDTTPMKKNISYPYHPSFVMEFLDFLDFRTTLQNYYAISGSVRAWMVIRMFVKLCSSRQSNIEANTPKVYHPDCFSLHGSSKLVVSIQTAQR